MKKNILKYIWDYKKVSFWDLNLLDKDSSLALIELLYQENIRIYWFDGFYLLEKWKYQIDQDFSRDYSRFSLQESYELCKEYFLKSRDKNIFYEISFSEADQILNN